MTILRKSLSLLLLLGGGTLCYFGGWLVVEAVLAVRRYVRTAAAETLDIALPGE